MYISFEKTQFFQQMFMNNWTLECYTFANSLTFCMCIARFGFLIKKIIWGSIVTFSMFLGRNIHLKSLKFEWKIVAKINFLSICLLNDAIIRYLTSLSLNSMYSSPRNHREIPMVQSKHYISQLVIWVGK